MKIIPAAALTAFLLTPLALHAQPPDFSGRWTMDLSRSQSAQQGEAIRTVSFVIAQGPSQVRIETMRGNEKENILYPLNASRASTSPAPGETGHPEAYWEGDRLVTETQRPVSGQTVTVKEVRALAPGGAEMTVETTVIVQHGYSMPGAKNYGSSRDVFTRAKP